MGCLAHLGSLGLFQRALGVFAIILGRLVHSGAPWASSRSVAFVGLIQVRPGGLWVHSGAPLLS